MSDLQETHSENHPILGGKVNVYKRPESSYWQCIAFIDGKRWRHSLKEDSLSRAKELAEDWYLELRGKFKAGLLDQTAGRKKNELTYAKLAEKFLLEYQQLTEGQRSPIYIYGIGLRLNVHLIPYFGKLGISQITAGKIQEYRLHRHNQCMEKNGEPPARNTIHQEIVTLRQSLKTALRHGWITHLPDMSAPYNASGKVSHRAWFTPEEYKSLYEATRNRAQNPTTPGHKWDSEQLHDFVLFMANTGLRPDEVKRLQFRDVKIIDDDDTDQTILLIEVRGKRGLGYCKSMPNAVRPFERLRDRKRYKQPWVKGETPELVKPEPTDLLFPKWHHELFKTILNELKLRADRDGRPRTIYSLRHTYICFRLLEGADVYQVAKNCRTSVEMIQKFYAIHLQNTINAAQVNVMRPKKKKKKGTSRPSAEEDK